MSNFYLYSDMDIHYIAIATFQRIAFGLDKAPRTVIGSCTLLRELGRLDGQLG